MASVNYGHGVNAVVTGDVQFDADTFKCMLVSDAYVPNVDTHQYRSSVTNEVGASGDYAAGGATLAAPTITKDDANNRIEIAFVGPSFANATITARAAVIYKDTGNAATDRLVSYVDFGSNVVSTNGTFAVTFNTPLRFNY